MHGSLSGLRASCERSCLVVVLYGLLLVAAVVCLVRVGAGAVVVDPMVAVALVGVAVGAYVAEEGVRDRRSATLDTTLALALIALALAGPLVAFAVALVPEAIRLARRRGVYCTAGLLANVVSYALAPLAGATVLAIAPTHGTAGRAGALLLAGAAMAVTNYLFARLLFSAIRDRAPVIALVRREFLPLLPLELVIIAVGVGGGLLIAVVGPVALGVFAVLVYLPPLGLEMLLRAPSVAGLSVDAAAAVFRAALSDELALSRRDRNLIEQTDALVQRRRPPGDSARNPLALMQDALLVTVCGTTTSTQAAFTASPRAQVVLAARRWAQLTARCTPALNHREALAELHRGSLADDAPWALAAAGRIIDRESALTAHVAGVPRLHRAPLPRRARQQLLPRALARLAG